MSPHESRLVPEWPHQKHVKHQNVDEDFAQGCPDHSVLLFEGKVPPMHLLYVNGYRIIGDFQGEHNEGNSEIAELHQPTVH